VRLTWIRYPWGLHVGVLLRARKLPWSLSSAQGKRARVTKTGSNEAEGGPSEAKEEPRGSSWLRHPSRPYPWPCSKPATRSEAEVVAGRGLLCDPRDPTAHHGAPGRLKLGRPRSLAVDHRRLLRNASQNWCAATSTERTATSGQSVCVANSRAARTHTRPNNK